MKVFAGVLRLKQAELEICLRKNFSLADPDRILAERLFFDTPEAAIGITIYRQLEQQAQESNSEAIT